MFELLLFTSPYLVTNSIAFSHMKDEQKECGIGAWAAPWWIGRWAFRYSGSGGGEAANPQGLQLAGTVSDRV